MNPAIRVVPCLDVVKGRVVKGLKFENLRDAGDPVEAARRYERDGADELAFLDIAAAQEARGTLVALVSRVAEVLSIPFTVGGGVRSVEDAAALLAAGADRVTVNTAAVLDPSLISRLAERFGTQCIIVAVDGKRAAGEDGVLRTVVTTHGGRRVTNRELGSWVAEATSLGAGEILVTSVDADGTRSGFDVDMLRIARAATAVPVIASGGAGSLDHFAAAVLEGGADAVLAASVFHERTFTIGAVKQALTAKGIVVRPIEDPLAAVRFGADGLVPVVVRDAGTGAVLTLAYANRAALDRTRETGLSHFFSRSRQTLWKKGETSGHVQRVVSIALDCDADAVLYDALPEGPACHTGADSCFVEIDRLRDEPPRLNLAPLLAVVADRAAHPVDGSYTNRLLGAGVERIAKKVGEEAVEVALAALGSDDDAFAGEAADLLYHFAVLLSAKGIDARTVERKLAERRGAPRRRES